MPLDRRQLFSAVGLGFSACRVPRWLPGQAAGDGLDRVLKANVQRLPERPGAGANHYPMAAEALEALGREDAIQSGWTAGAANYPAGPPLARLPIQDEGISAALGSYERFADWRLLFREALATYPWQAVVSDWAPQLAPGLSGAAFHGILRAGHAARALRRHDSAPRREELAVGLAYWAARYHEVPATVPPGGLGMSVAEALQALEFSWADDSEPVDFFGVDPHLTGVARIPSVSPPTSLSTARRDLRVLVREAAVGFLEMLVAKRHRIWLLHTVTGPAAVDLLLPHVEERGACALVAHAQRAVLAAYAAFGEPFEARAHVRGEPAPWSEILERVTASPTVHGVKLIEALLRFEDPADPLWRSVAAEFLDWT